MSEARQRERELAEAAATVAALEKATAAVAPLDRAALYRCCGGDETATGIHDALSNALGLAGEHLRRLREPE